MYVCWVCYSCYFLKEWSGAWILTHLGLISSIFCNLEFIHVLMPVYPAVSVSGFPLILESHSVQQCLKWWAQCWNIDLLIVRLFGTDIRGITSSTGQVVVKEFMQLIYLELRCIIEWAKKVPGWCTVCFSKLCQFTYLLSLIQLAFQ